MNRLGRKRFLVVIKGKKSQYQFSLVDGKSNDIVDWKRFRGNVYNSMYSVDGIVIKGNPLYFSVTRFLGRQIDFVVSVLEVNYWEFSCTPALSGLHKLIMLTLQLVKIF